MPEDLLQDGADKPHQIFPTLADFGDFLRHLIDSTAHEWAYFKFERPHDLQ